MTEEEYFRKNYPDSCYGDKPLSPHWDFFQSGVEFGERQSEKRIAKLEAQIENIKSDVISERDEALRVEDIITYGVLNDIIDKWEIKEND